MTFEKILDRLNNRQISTQQALDEITKDIHQKPIKFFINKKNINNEKLKDGELNQLNSIIQIAQILYNEGLNTTISDDDYDTLQEMAIDMGIPRQTGAKEISLDGKSNHKYLNLRGTLNKVYYLDPEQKRTNKSRKYLHEWIKSIETKYYKATGEKRDLSNERVLIQPKFDGVSCVLENDGSTMKWLTRGDTANNKASDVSMTMNIFNDVFREYINSGIKFEVMMSEENLSKINELIRENPYKNSRQVVTSILNSKDIDFKADYLYPVPLRIIDDGDDIERIHPILKKDFPTFVCSLRDIDMIRNFANDNKYISINGHRLRTDGAVITILDPEIQRVLGRDNNINNFEVAYKFTEEFAYSKVRDVEFYVSEFGYITPVVVVNDTILKGNTINRISLSNRERFDELDLAYGDDVKVLYDIIPYVTIDDKCRRVKNGRKIPFTMVCPKCKSELDLTAVQVQCKNDECPSRIIGRILNYCNNVNMQNFGYPTLEDLYNEGLLKNGIRSLYKLKKKTYDMSQIPGFGKLKINKLIKEIEATRKLYDYQLMGAIGIESLSVKTFELILSKIPFNEFIDTIQDDAKLLRGKLVLITGIGPKKADVLIKHFSTAKNRKEFMKLLDEINIIQSYSDIPNDIKGIIVFSGCRTTDDDKLTMLKHG